MHVIDEFAPQEVFTFQKVEDLKKGIVVASEERFDGWIGIALYGTAGWGWEHLLTAALHVPKHLEGDVGVAAAAYIGKAFDVVMDGRHVAVDLRLHLRPGKIRIQDEVHHVASVFQRLPHTGAADVDDGRQIDTGFGPRADTPAQGDEGVVVGILGENDQAGGGFQIGEALDSITGAPDPFDEGGILVARDHDVGAHRRTLTLTSICS